MFINLLKRLTNLLRPNQDLALEVKRQGQEIAWLQERLSETLARDQQRELERTVQEQQVLQQQVASEAMRLTEVVTTHTMTPPSRDTGEIEIKITKLRDKIEQINGEVRSALDNTSPYLESELQSEIYKKQNTRINPLRDDLAALNHELARSKLAKLYRPIDMNFLQRRKWSPQLQLPVPRFASFDFNRPACELRVTSYFGQPPTTRGTMLPPGLERFYESTITSFANHAKTAAKMNANLLTGIAATFPGALPSDLRSILPQVKTHFSGLFTVTEAPDWNVLVTEVSDCRDECPRIPPTLHKSQEQDALLIGELRGTYWLVTPFRTIATADYISQHLKAK